MNGEIDAGKARFVKVISWIWVQAEMALKR